MDYPGGFITKTAPTLNPALGNAAPGVWRLNDVLKNIKAGTWPAYDPYFDYTTLLLHGNGTNGGQNNTFLDSGTANSGSGFTITRNGDTTQGTFSPFSVGAGYWSNYFNNTTGLSMPTGSGTPTFWNSDFTIEYWVNCSSSKSINTVLSSWFDGSFGGGSWWLPIIDGAVQLFHNQSSSSNQGPFITSGSTLVNDNRWHHVAITQVTGGNKTFRIFIDGVLRGYTTQTNWTQASANATIYVGAPGPGTFDETLRYMLGSLSNIRLTTSVVAAYSTSATTLGTTVFTPPTSPLTAISGTYFLICQSNRFVDNSASSFTLTVNGTPSVQAFSPFAPTAAYSASTVGGSGYFDGSGDYLALPDNAAFDLGLSSQAFTIETFFYPTTTTTGYQMLFARGGGAAAWNGTDGWQYAFFLYNNSLYFQFWSGSGLVSMSGSLSAAQIANQFNHLVVSYDGSNVSIFANGARLSTTTSALGKPTASNITQVGKSVVSAETYYPTGYIASLRVVKGTAVYSPTQTTYTVPTAPLTNITNTSLLLNFTNAAIIDNTAKNDLVTYGNAQISTAQSKFGGASLYFDGTGDWLTSPATVNTSFGTGNFTVECWIYSTVNQNNNLIVSNRVTAVDTAWSLEFYNNGTGNNILNWHSGTTIIMYANTAANTNTWNHVAVVRSGTTTKIYLNGTEVASATDSRNYSYVGPVQVGYEALAGTSGIGYYNGYIDDLRITKGIARYTSNFTPQTSQWQDQ